MEKKLDINDLLFSLQKPEKSNDINNQTYQIPDFMSHVQKGKGRKVDNISKSRQQMMKRQTNYEMTKQQMDKWIGIVKLNREKQSLNFVKRDVSDLNVNFFPAQPISDFHKKMQNKLKQMNVQSQKSVLRQENQTLEKLDPEQAKRRLLEARKHRTTIFNEEQKRRRIAKIKSKLYHKIKKRQKMREEVKKVDQMNPVEKNEYIEGLTKKRIKQRISLRHNSKNKHIQNLLRFQKSEKDGIQASMNQLNQIRRKQLQKVNQNVMEDISEDYDDQNFREEAMRDLQNEIQALENDDMDIEDDKAQSSGAMLNDLKFMQVGKKNKQNKDKREAYKLLGKLADGEQLSENDFNSEMDEQQPQKKKIQLQEEEENDGMPVNRKVYGKKMGDGINQEQKIKNKSIQSQLNKFLVTSVIEEENNKDGQNNKSDNFEAQLISGINVQRLQQKYQPDRIPIDLSSLIAANKQIYQEQDNEAALQNMRQFQQQKVMVYENQMNERQGKDKNKKLKGWGTWAGPGIQEKKIDPQEELRKKLKKIEQIKQKRKDASLAHVTINESRNKKLSEYFVKNLPHNYGNADQFDFIQNEAVGQEWNSLTQFKDNVKPKVITKAGQVIEAARLPKKVQNLNKTKN